MVLVTIFNALFSLILWVLKALLLMLFGGLWAGFLAGCKRSTNVDQSERMIRMSRDKNRPLPK
jgi:hypothetical protein